MACPKCGSEKLRYSDTFVDPFPVNGATLETACGTAYCAKCGTKLGDTTGTELPFAEAIWLSRTGVADGDTFRSMRSSLGFRAADLARLLQVRPETISNWERAKRPMDRAAWAVLAAMVEDCLACRTTVFDRLVRALNPDTPKGKVRLEAPVYRTERVYPGTKMKMGLPFGITRGGRRRRRRRNSSDAS